MVLTNSRMGAAVAAALLALGPLSGCGDDKTVEATMPAADGGADSATTIKIVDFVYDPTPATVKAGEKVSVPNADAAPHTITDTGSGKAFDSGTIKGKATGSVTFKKAGTYSYVCEFHPFMKGEVTVTK